MAEDNSATETRRTQRQTVAKRLGYAGLVPAIVLSLWLVGIPADHPWRGQTIALLTAYAAIVLSFLGGIRWGVAMLEADEQPAQIFALSVLPALGAWVAFFLPAPYSFVLLAVAFAAHGAWDTLSAQNEGMPDWFARLRIQLTIVIVVTMILAFAGTATS